MNIDTSYLNELYDTFYESVRKYLLLNGVTGEVEINVSISVSEEGE